MVRASLNLSALVAKSSINDGKTVDMRFTLSQPNGIKQFDQWKQNDPNMYLILNCI